MGHAFESNLKQSKNKSRILSVRFGNRNTNHCLESPLPTAGSTLEGLAWRTKNNKTFASLYSMPAEQSTTSSTATTAGRFPNSDRFPERERRNAIVDVSRTLCQKHWRYTYRNRGLSRLGCRQSPGRMRLLRPECRLCGEAYIFTHACVRGARTEHVTHVNNRTVFHFSKTSYRFY